MTNRSRPVGGLAEGVSVIPQLHSALPLAKEFDTIMERIALSEIRIRSGFRRLAHGRGIQLSGESLNHLLSKSSNDEAAGDTTDRYNEVLRLLCFSYTTKLLVGGMAVSRTVRARDWLGYALEARGLVETIATIIVDVGELTERVRSARSVGWMPHDLLRLRHWILGRMFCHRADWAAVIRQAGEQTNGVTELLEFAERLDDAGGNMSKYIERAGTILAEPCIGIEGLIHSPPGNQVRHSDAMARIELFCKQRVRVTSADWLPQQYDLLCEFAHPQRLGGTMCQMLVKDGDGASIKLAMLPESKLSDDWESLGGNALGLTLDSVVRLSTAAVLVLSLLDG